MVVRGIQKMTPTGSLYFPVFVDPTIIYPHGKKLSSILFSPPDHFPLQQLL
jgi:hypothetical protein